MSDIAAAPECLMRRLIRDGHAASTDASFDLIEAGRVYVDGVVVEDAARIVDAGAGIWVEAVGEVVQQ